MIILRLLHSQLYKYKWNGLEVDTLEYVFRKNKRGDDENFEYYRINERGDTSRIKAIRKEYLSLNDFDSMGVAFNYEDDD